MKKNSIFGRGRRAFTLVELLVVVAIIGVLATVVFVSYDKSQAKARDAKRISDLDSVKTALYMYKDDKGTIPQKPGLSGHFCEFAYPNVDTDFTDPDIFKELLDGGYLNVIPSDPGNNRAKRVYYYYIKEGSGTTCPTGTICGFLIANLETWKGTSAYPGSYRGTLGLESTNNTWCRISLNDSTYCVSEKFAK